MNVCIIPARGGSQRIPGKNKKLFHGKPIIEYAIDAAKNADIFDYIFVSTDDPDIDEIACKHGTQFHRRKGKYAQNEIGTQEVIKNVLSEVIMSIDDLDRVCCLYATTPLLDYCWLRDADRMLELENDYVFSVGVNPLHDAGQFYYGWARSFSRGYPLISTDSVMFPIPPERDCDINTPEDWERAEKMYEALHGK